MLVTVVAALSIASFRERVIEVLTPVCLTTLEKQLTRPDDWIVIKEWSMRRKDACKSLHWYNAFILYYDTSFGSVPVHVLVLYLLSCAPSYQWCLLVASSFMRNGGRLRKTIRVVRVV